MSKGEAPSVVVGAAITEHGRLLAARRTAPPETAGGWEFPGGKVRPGEAPEDACVREVREELGCEVRVVRRIPGAQPLNPGFVLHLYEAEIVSGDPHPHEHDALRWLMPEELDEVAWLDADRPFLVALKDLLLDGEWLEGGHVGGAMRIGDTVRRPTGPWTPAVHALLEHLATKELDGVPRVLGTDERGREILTFLPGRVVSHDAGGPDEVLVQVMRWLARYHAAVADFRPPGEVQWRFEKQALGPGEIVCHHDVAPYNVIVDESQEMVGVIDWDVAGPGTPVDDLAFSAWNFVPLWRDVGIDEGVRRLRLLCSSYGEIDPATVLEHVVPRISRAVRKIYNGQQIGDPGMLRLATIGEPESTERALHELQTRLPALHAALRD